jgi:nicotinate-nucleotide pyrophosphorylase (carboxylating)
VSTALLSESGAAARFRLIARRAGVFCGCEIALSVLRAYDPGISIDWGDDIVDGANLGPSQSAVATIHGPIGPILSAERVLLNFLSRLCGVATLTRDFVSAVEGTEVDIYDTRKTIPGWRVLDKYAVRCGGGQNHRQGLFDAVLIKDNHFSPGELRRTAATVFELLNHLSGRDEKPAFVEVEADILAQLEELLKVVGIDLILLDNFAVQDLRRAVELRDSHGLRGKVILEASGGITLANVRDVAETGVERISVGALTHSAPALDLSLERVG